MDQIKDYDDEGFELQFENIITEEEKKYYVRTYPNINMVADRRVHCTACDGHMGTAPGNEKNIRMHPVLRVTQCKKCNQFYNSGEFDKGEDGSELYCRWCGQGGEVYCCSSCAYVFCRKCILRNLSHQTVDEIENNDFWKCFSCAPKIMWPLQAQHWALMNFIAKQKAVIDKQAKSGRDSDEIVDALNNDSTTCCRSKQTRLRDSSKIKKRTREPSDDSSGETSSTRSATSERSKKKPLPKKQKLKVTKVTLLSDTNKTPAAKKASPLQQSVETMPDLSAFCSAELGDDASASVDETVGAPDLFEFLSNRSISMTAPEPEPTAVVPPLTVLSNASPSPIVIQNVLSGNAAQQNINSMGASPSSRPTHRQPNSVTRVSANTIRVNTTPTTEPVYHVINGYKIDLNSASQQNTIRLPNGKIIHVKKQPVLPNGQAARQPNARMTRPPILPARAAPVPQQIQRPPNALPRQMAVVRQQAPPIQMPPAPRMVQRSRQISSITSFEQSASAILQSMQQMQQRSIQSMQQRQQPQQSPQQQQQQHQQQQQQQQVATARSNAQMEGAVRTAAMQANASQIQQALHPSIIAQQQKNSIVAAGPRKYPAGPVGMARTQFERQIFNGLEICQLIESKLKTLMNSNAYKNVRNVNDIKELQIHMSYLLTFTLGRFKTLQDKCMDDMRKLGFQSEADSLAEGNVIKKYGSDNDEDDIEIVEPQHATIDLDDSDDEQPKKTPDKSGARKKTTTTPPSHLASAISAAQSLAAMIQGQSQIRAAPIARIERTPEVVRAVRTPPIARAERTSSSIFRAERPPSVARPIESTAAVSTSIVDNSAEDIECEADIMALLQPQVILNDHDELELPTPPPLTPTPIDDIPDDPKLKGRAQVRLKRADEEFPELMNMLGKKSASVVEVSDAQDENEDNEVDKEIDSANGKSTNDAIEVDSDNDAADKSVDMVDDVVADYEDAINRLQELSSEICASPAAITNDSAQAERTEADNTIDEFVSVLEISDTSTNKTTSTAEKSATNEPMDADEFMSILDLPDDIIAAVDEASAKTVDANDKTNDGEKPSEIEPTSQVESGIDESTYKTSDEMKENAVNSKSKDNEEEMSAELSVEKETEPEATDNEKTNEQMTNELLTKDHNDEVDESDVHLNATKEQDSTIDTTTEQQTTLNDLNANEDDSFENISSPDTFDDYAKNGVAGKHNETDIFDEAIDELLCENISAIAN